MLLTIFLNALALAAAPLVSPGEKYDVKASLKSASPEFKQLNDFRVVLDSELQSYQGDSALPNVISHTRQTMVLKQKDLKDLKDGEARIETSFERFETLSKVTIPGIAKPMEMKQDFGLYLMGNPFTLVQKDGEVVRVEGMDVVRKKMETVVKDTITRLTLTQVLTDDLVRRSAVGFVRTAHCVDQLGGKKPGDKWTQERKMDGKTEKVDCVFDGWAETKGKKLAVIKVTIPFEKKTVTLPNGKQAETESQGTGRVIAEPESGESLLTMDSKTSSQDVGAKDKSRTSVRATTHRQVM